MGGGAIDVVIEDCNEFSRIFGNSMCDEGGIKTLNLYGTSNSVYKGATIQYRGNDIQVLDVITYDDNRRLGSAYLHLWTGSSHPYYITDDSFYPGEMYVSNRMFSVEYDGTILFEFKYGDTSWIDDYEGENHEVISMCYVNPSSNYTIANSTTGILASMYSAFSNIKDFRRNSIVGGQSLWFYCA